MTAGLEPAAGQMWRDRWSPALTVHVDQVSDGHVTYTARWDDTGPVQAARTDPISGFVALYEPGTETERMVELVVVATERQVRAVLADETFQTFTEGCSLRTRPLPPKGPPNDVV